MTRDEAVKLLNKRIWDSGGSLNTKNWINAFVDLGMLKLDEPPSISDLVVRADWWTRIGGAVEVSAESMAEAIKLIGEMKAALQRPELSR